MEKLICIDFGSSYTKVAVRTNWNEDSHLLTNLSNDDNYNFCLPSTVACVEKNGQSTWLIGDDALDRDPGDNVRLYQNWKGDLFTEGSANRDCKTVATQFFQGLMRKLIEHNPQFGTLPIRVCVPRLHNESFVESQMLDVLKCAGIKVADYRPCIFEPEANAYGLTTRGRNYICPRTKYSTGIGPSFVQMFEKDSLFTSFRRAALQSGNLHYSILVVDLGSFTADFGCVTFAASDGDSDEFILPVVVQESLPIGISQLDKAVLEVLDRQAQLAIKVRRYRVWEDIKKDIYNGQEAAIKRSKGGMIVIGEDNEAEAITNEIDKYAKKLVRACDDFCKRHNLTPARTQGNRVLNAGKSSE